MAFRDDGAEKARVLVEALPYIQKFAGKTIVIKYGGHAMVDPLLKESVMLDVLLLHSVGIRPVLVHGGGPEINAMLKKVGKESQFVHGLRVTDAETMEIAAMVLVGKLNTEIVSIINRFGGKAVGLSGKDASLFLAEKKPMRLPNSRGEMEEIDLGYVGEIYQVAPDLIETLLDRGYIPVISPLAGGEDGETYNINADTAAGKVAEALKADKFLLLTDVRGVLRTLGEPESLISTIRREEVTVLMEQGVFSGGMMPKVECAIAALAGGVGSVHIFDGRLPHAILLELFTDGGIGTMFT
ncbi:acetylglutamate kinase [Acididesulfobacillus acetoxydans]|uniref:Acetylglutamate kinase n=1 Tax=Acididesulfobacillus acetoxydans TaxID=1561005 RepID=A0A8S0XVE9_9FIRM|nr:acetylglutamate kinase [Acididesulfobacillus acetoxydans]CAA7600277.1 acetylglutamate kinase [Acididesulfobacillus acetoxydans]CEJ06053.1 Acetylglutamate kinase [Acididesulfobacillus acetoxydans]